jgi:hypothetical protein
MAGNNSMLKAEPVRGEVSKISQKSFILEPTIKAENIRWERKNGLNEIIQISPADGGHIIDVPDHHGCAGRGHLYQPGFIYRHERGFSGCQSL